MKRRDVAKKMFVWGDQNVVYDISNFSWLKIIHLWGMCQEKKWKKEILGGKKELKCSWEEL